MNSSTARVWAAAPSAGGEGGRRSTEDGDEWPKSTTSGQGDDQRAGAASARPRICRTARDRERGWLSLLCAAAVYLGGQSGLPARNQRARSSAKQYRARAAGLLRARRAGRSIRLRP